MYPVKLFALITLCYYIESEAVDMSSDYFTCEISDSCQIFINNEKWFIYALKH